MHVIGLCVAAPCAWLLHRFCLRGQPTPPYFMELPAYKPPNLRHTLGRVYASGRDFIVRAGTVIFAMTIVIWALLYFPRPPELAQQFEQDRSAVTADPFFMMEPLQAESERLHAMDAAYLEQSYLGRMGKWLQPVFAPAGYDWKITVGILASFPARGEIIVSTLGIAYALGGDVDDQSSNLRSRLAAAKWGVGADGFQPVFTIAVALSLMVFFALCMQWRDVSPASTRTQLGLGDRKLWLRLFDRLVSSCWHLSTQPLPILCALVDIVLVALCLLSAVLYLGHLS